MQEIDLVNIVRHNRRWQSVYAICRDNDLIPFRVNSPFELTAFQARLLNISSFYDIIYSTGEEIPDEILDDLDRAKAWYDNWKDSRKTGGESNADYSNPYKSKYQHVYTNN